MKHIKQVIDVESLRIISDRLLCMARQMEIKWTGKVCLAVWVGGGQGYFYQGGRGASPLEFWQPKKVKTLVGYVKCGTILRRVAAAAKCESSAIDFWIFLKPFLDVLWDIWTSESRGV